MKRLLKSKFIPRVKKRYNVDIRMAQPSFFISEKYKRKIKCYCLYNVRESGLFDRLRIKYLKN